MSPGEEAVMEARAAVDEVDMDSLTAVTGLEA